jgi:hypothetical protein
MMTVLVPADNLSVPTQFAGGYLASNAQDIALGSPAGKFEFKAAGPHFRQDGTTLNTADFYIMLPRIAVQEVLGIPDPSANASLYDVARDGGAPISDVLFAINVMTGEITAYYPGFGFSTPTFVWKAASTDNGGGGGDNGGSGGSGGSSGSTDTTPTLATPVPLPAPPVLGPVPVVPDPPANPAVVTPVAPGVKLLAAAAAANVAPRLMLNYPTVRMGKAPHVPAMTSHPVALVAQGMNPNAMFTVKIKVNGVYSVLGRVRADAKGMLALPVFTVSRPGVYTIALVNEANGSVRYLKVDVTRGQG